MYIITPWSIALNVTLDRCKQITWQYLSDTTALEFKIRPNHNNRNESASFGNPRLHVGLPVRYQKIPFHSFQSGMALYGKWSVHCCVNGNTENSSLILSYVYHGIIDSTGLSIFLDNGW